MKPDGCDRVLDEIVQGGPLSTAAAAHVAACPTCAGEADVVRHLKKRKSAYEVAALAPLRAKVLATSIPVGPVGSGTTGLSIGVVAKVLVPVVIAGVLSWFALSPRPASPRVDLAQPGSPAVSTVIPGAGSAPVASAEAAAVVPGKAAGQASGSATVVDTGLPTTPIETGPGNYLPPSDE